MFLDVNDATEMIFLNSLLSHVAQKLHSAAFQTFCLGAAANQGKAGLKGEELKNGLWGSTKGQYKRDKDYFELWIMQRCPNHNRLLFRNIMG